MSAPKREWRLLEGVRALRGHKGMVTCSALCETDPHLVATGSEDATIRLWDVRTGKSVRLLSCGAPVASIMSAPTPERWTCAMGNKIVAFDLRGNDRVLINDHSVIAETAEDINDFIHILDGEATQYACVDDEGTLTLIGSERTSVTAHSNSIAMCVRLCSNDLIVSGGFDNALVFTSRSITKEVARLPLLPSGNMSALLNPPHIYSIDVSMEAGVQGMGAIVVGVGDGSVAFFEPWHGVRDKSMNWHKVQQMVARVPEVHMAPTACTRFVHPELVGSAGNDNSLILLAKKKVGRPRIVESFTLPAKPNAVAFPHAFSGCVLICDIGNEPKLASFARA